MVHPALMMFLSFLHPARRKMEMLAKEGYRAEVIEFEKDGKRGQIDKHGRVTWHDRNDDDQS